MARNALLVKVWEWSGILETRAPPPVLEERGELGAGVITFVRDTLLRL